MGINAMENDVYQPQNASALSKVWNVGVAFLVGFVIIFAIGYGVMWLINWYSTPAPVAALIEKAASTSPQVQTRQYCYNGKCVDVPMCTAINDECGSIEPGQHVEQSKQLPASSSKLNAPKAGWGNATDEELLNMDIDSAWKEVDTQMQQGKLKPLGDGSYK